MIGAKIKSETRRKIYRREGWQCALCGSTKDLQIHHIIHRGHGGLNTQQNLIALCGGCHCLAHGRDVYGIGATQEDAEQAITEYMADLYANEGFAWNPWSRRLVPLAPAKRLQAGRKVEGYDPYIAALDKRPEKDEAYWNDFIKLMTDDEEDEQP